MKTTIKTGNLEGNRKLSELLKEAEKVYVWFQTEHLCRLFYEQAEVEGFVFGDGSLPTTKDTTDIIALNEDLTMSYVNFIGHIAFRNPELAHAKKLICVDYGKYRIGREDYLMENGETRYGA